MRRLFRWALYLFVVMVALLVATVLLIDRIAREIVENRLRATTGMDARIEKIEIGLLSPTITIENFKLYNTADFGGSLFIDMPELHLEYDLKAVRSGNLHFKLVRLNLAEVALVQDKKGRMNVQDMNNKSRAASHGNNIKFTGIDTLNLTLGKFRRSSLASGREEEIDFGIKDQISRNVKSEADVPGLNMLTIGRGGTVSSSTNSELDVSALLQSLISH